MKTRVMGAVVFGPDGAWTRQRAELSPDGWHRWPGARPTSRHHVELREGDLVLPLSVEFENEAALRLPPRLRSRGDLELVDFEPWAQAEALDKVWLEGTRMVHRPGSQLVQRSGSDWLCEQLFFDVPPLEDEPSGLALACQSHRSEVSVPPWRPEAGVWQVRPPRDFGPVRLRSGEPLWLGEGQTRRPATLRQVWRLGDGPHPRRELVDGGLVPGRRVELFVDAARRSEQRAGAGGELVVGYLADLEVEASSEADAEPNIVRHALQVQNEDDTPACFDWRVALDPEDAARVVEMEDHAEWDVEGLRIPVWVPARGRAEAKLRLQRTRAESSWTPTQS